MSDFSNKISAPITLGTESNEDGLKKYLTELRWPLGLQSVIYENLERFPVRFFICDDSGSMIGTDGQRLVTYGKKTTSKFIACSRWAELTETLKFHLGLAQAASAPTEFRFLNNGVPILAGQPNQSTEDGIKMLKSYFACSPGGGTPLCKHIRDVIEKITPIEEQLKANGQKACIVIATDGESTDGDVVAAMRPLEHMPVWIVIRLCTDEARVVNYWNNIDSQLELNMDVLDDLSREAKEVHSGNSWLTYGEALHRVREFGIPLKEMDLLDEKKLSPDELRTMCWVVLGGNIDEYPHPAADFDDFISVLETKIKDNPEVWSPAHSKMRPWIEVQSIIKIYKRNKCACM